jgi:hypothetical protein
MMMMNGMQFLVIFQMTMILTKEKFIRIMMQKTVGKQDSKLQQTLPFTTTLDKDVITVQTVTKEKR